MLHSCFVAGPAPRCSFNMSVSESDSYTQSDTYEDRYDDNGGAAEIVDAQIMPGDSEKGKILTMFDDLRKESTFSM